MTYIRRDLPGSGIRAVFDRAKEMEAAGQTILHLEIGRPDWEPPPGAVAEVERALEAGFHHYIPNRGISELREALSHEIRLTTGQIFHPESELIVTVGATEAVSICALALLGPGDECIIPMPAWNHYEVVTQMAGAVPVALNLRPECGFIIDPEELSKLITPRTRAIVLNTPSNPTGAVQPPEVLEAIAEIALKHRIFVLSDEVYQDFVFEGQHHSIGRYMDDSELFIHLNSFSKSYGMTGWRIGYIAARKRVSDALNRVHQYLTVCGTSFAQKGASAALRHPERKAYLNKMREAFRERYLVWKDALAQCPAVELVAPQGAFYLFPKVNYRNMSGDALAAKLLNDHHVAVVPGHIFGKQFDRHVRISYGLNLDTQRAAAARFVEVFK